MIWIDQRAAYTAAPSVALPSGGGRGGSAADR